MAAPLDGGAVVARDIASEVAAMLEDEESIAQPQHSDDEDGPLGEYGHGGGSSSGGGGGRHAGAAGGAPDDYVNDGNLDDDDSDDSDDATSSEDDDDDVMLDPDDPLLEGVQSVLRAQMTANFTALQEELRERVRH